MQKSISYNTETYCHRLGTMSTFTFFSSYYEPFSRLEETIAVFKRIFNACTHIYVLFISDIITLNKGTFFFHHAYINKMIFFYLTFLSLTLSSSYPHMNYDKTTKNKTKKNLFFLLTMHLMHPMQ